MAGIRRGGAVSEPSEASAVLAGSYTTRADATARTHRLALAGESIVVSFSSAALADLYMPGLTHLEALSTASTGTNSADRPFRVLVFDTDPSEKSSFVELVRHSLSPSLLLPPLQARFQDDGTDNPKVWAFYFFDPGSRFAAVWVKAVTAVPHWELNAPLLSIWHFALTHPGRSITHAAVVGDGRGGVLLAGPGGSGKSTTALAAVLGGMSCVGEDYVVVDLSPSGPYAHTLFDSAKVSPSVRRLIPDLPAALDRPPPPGMDKTVITIAEIRPGAHISPLPLRAVLLPHIGADRCRTLPCSAAQALKALAPSTIFQLPRDGGSALGTLAALVRLVPCFILELDHDPMHAVSVISQVLEHAAA